MKKKLTLVQLKRRSHAISRAMDRFGVVISNYEYELMIQEIQDINSDTFLLRSSKSRAFHQVQFKNETLTALYSTTSRSIITFFHNGWLVKDAEGNWQLKGKKRKKRK